MTPARSRVPTWVRTALVLALVPLAVTALTTREQASSAVNPPATDATQIVAVRLSGSGANNSVDLAKDAIVQVDVDFWIVHGTATGTAVSSIVVEMSPVPLVSTTTTTAPGGASTTTTTGGTTTTAAHAVAETTTTTAAGEATTTTSTPGGLPTAGPPMATTTLRWTLSPTPVAGQAGFDVLSGDATGGSGRARLAVPVGSATGTWRVTRVELRDTGGGTYTAANPVDGGTPWVTPTNLPNPLVPPVEIPFVASSATTTTTTTGPGGFVRVAGPTRYETAVAAAAKAFPNGAKTVYLATGEDFPDALAAGPAAWVDGGPVLLTKATELPASTVAELERLKPDRVVITGGERAVSAAVEQAVRNLGVGTVERRAGADRYQTAALIAAKSFPNATSTVFVATGKNFPDALAGAAAAVASRSPLLLVELNLIPGDVAKELDRLDPAKAVILGDNTVVGDIVAERLRTYAGTVERLEGADRYETAARIAEGRFPGAQKVVYVAAAYGQKFPDALSASSLIGVTNGPLLLANDGCLTGATEDALRRANPGTVVVMGDETAVSDSAMRTRCGATGTTTTTAAHSES